jgi:hypothetical protein
MKSIRMTYGRRRIERARKQYIRAYFVVELLKIITKLME